MKARRFYRTAAFLSLIPVAAQPAWSIDITTEVNQTVATSTVNNGVPDDIDITTGGSILIEDAAYSTGVLIDSDNDLINRRTISIVDLDNTTGVLIQGNRQTNITSTGLITLPEDYERTDLDDDGDLDGPRAEGVNRYGIWLDNAGPMVGDIDLDFSSAISVEGNSSGAIRLDSLLDGSLTNDGAITLIGDDGTAIDLRGGASGSLLQSGTVLVNGANSRGIRVADGLGGSFVNEGGITTSGFINNSLTNYDDPESPQAEDFPIADRIDAEDLGPNGFAVSIGGSLGQGFLNNGTVDTFVSAEDAADTSKDTIEDFDENRSTGTINTFGSAPALIISPDAEGSDTGDVVIGRLVENIRDTLDDDDDDNFDEIIGTFNYDYGLVNRGTVSANGLNVGFEATGARIAGLTDGSRRVLIEGGLQNTGTISAVAAEADARALWFGPYAETDLILNQGSIVSQVTTNEAHRADAILIEANARVDALINRGTISARANATDSGGVARAITDLSGSLTTITNQGNIGVQVNYLDAAQPRLGSAIAVDLSGHSATQGVTLTQSFRTPVDDINGDGTVDQGDVSAPAIIGDILFGAGNDTLDVQAGSVAAAQIDFGTGTDSLLLSNGASLSASLAGVDSISVDGAILDNLTTDPLVLSQLSVLGESALRTHIDTRTAVLSAPQISVTGNAVVDAASTLYLAVEGPLAPNLDIALIQANSLTLGSGTEQPTILIPAIYQSVISSSATELNIDLTTTNSAQELGLRSNETAAFESFIALASTDADVGTAIASYYDVDGLVSAYEQLLPDYGDSAWRYLASDLSLTSGVLATRLQRLIGGDGGVWFDFSGATFDQAATDLGVGFSGAGTSLQVGFDTPLGDGTAIGFSGGLRNGHGDPNKATEHRSDWTGYDLGLYGTYSGSRWSLFAAGSLGKLTLRSERQVVLGDIGETYEADWGGSYFAGSARTAYDMPLGSRLFLAPSLTLDYFAMNQDGFSESSGGGFDSLGLTLDDADSSRASGSFIMTLGRYNRGLLPQEQAGQLFNRRRFSQQLYVGYRTDLSSTQYNTTAQFTANSASSFEVLNPYLEEDALIYGLDLSWSPEGTTVLGIGYSGEQAGDYSTHRFYMELRIRW